MEPEHLGDGAYVSPGAYLGEVVLTANHHDLHEATDAVILNPEAVKRLREWLDRAAYEESSR